jgi:hypothetical protein
MRVQHVVLLKFAAALSATEQDELRAHVAAWPEGIGTMHNLRLAEPIDDARTAGYQYLLSMEFDGLDQLTAYQRHPLHRAFAAWGNAHGSRPLAFDYYLDATTEVSK